MMLHPCTLIYFLLPSSFLPTVAASVLLFLLIPALYCTHLHSSTFCFPKLPFPWETSLSLPCLAPQGRGAPQGRRGVLFRLLITSYRGKKTFRHYRLSSTYVGPASRWRTWMQRIVAQRHAGGERFCLRCLLLFRFPALSHPQKGIKRRL